MLSGGDHIISPCQPSRISKRDIKLQIQATKQLNLGPSLRIIIIHHYLELFYIFAEKRFAHMERAASFSQGTHVWP